MRSMNLRLIPGSFLASLAMLWCWPCPGRAQSDALAKSSTTVHIKEDLAVRRALEYLNESQKADGAWESGSFGGATSVTSLCVLAYLAAGHVPGDPGPYRATVEKGVRYVLAHQRSNGMLISNTSHGPMYCHGISTLMLSEVVGMTSEPELSRQCENALAKAVALILQAQEVPKSPEHAGGWRYQPTSRDSDLSVSGWQVIALRAARSAGCDVPSKAIDRAADYVARCAMADRRRRRVRLPAGPNRQQSPDRDGNPRLDSVRGLPAARSPCRRGLPRAASATLVQRVILL